MCQSSNSIEEVFIHATKDESKGISCILEIYK